jgi:hypothetical protein
MMDVIGLVPASATADALAGAGDDSDLIGGACAYVDVLSGQAATSMTPPLASKPWLARSSCCE